MPKMHGNNIPPAGARQCSAPRTMPFHVCTPPHIWPHINPTYGRFVFSLTGSVFVTPNIKTPRAHRDEAKVGARVMVVIRRWLCSAASGAIMAMARRQNIPVRPAAAKACLRWTTTSSCRPMDPATGIDSMEADTALAQQLGERLQNALSLQLCQHRRRIYSHPVGVSNPIRQFQCVFIRVYCHCVCGTCVVLAHVLHRVVLHCKDNAICHDCRDNLTCHTGMGSVACSCRSSDEFLKCWWVHEGGTGVTDWDTTGPDVNGGVSTRSIGKTNGGRVLGLLCLLRPRCNANG